VPAVRLDESRGCALHGGSHQRHWDHLRPLQLAGDAPAGHLV